MKSMFWKRIAFSYNAFIFDKQMPNKTRRYGATRFLQNTILKYFVASISTRSLKPRYKRMHRHTVSSAYLVHLYMIIFPILLVIVK